MELNRLERRLLFQVEDDYQSKALNVTKNVAIKKVLALIKEDSFITTTEMARQLSVNRQTT